MMRTKTFALTLLALICLVFAGTLSASLVACGGGGAQSANVTPGNMPEGEAWTGVYYHPVFGYLHMVEQDNNVVGKWKRTDQSAWGELSGTVTGNVVHFTWKEHKYNQVGPSSTSTGKGYFVYKMNSDKTAELDGQYGLNDDETGSEWHNVKQLHMTPDLNSITGAGDDGPSNGQQLQ
jgi:hypothetical protein